MSAPSLEVWADIWATAKQDEADAIKRRREAEDHMLSLIGIADNAEGTTNAEAPGGYKIKVVARIDRKVDGDLAQELAAKHGLESHLSALFRWKPELNKSQWDHAAQSIRDALAPAITAKPGRPSFAITKE